MYSKSSPCSIKLITHHCCQWYWHDQIEHQAAEKYTQQIWTEGMEERAWYYMILCYYCPCTLCQYAFSVWLFSLTIPCWFPNSITSILHNSKGGETKRQIQSYSIWSLRNGITKVNRHPDVAVMQNRTHLTYGIAYATFILSKDMPMLSICFHFFLRGSLIYVSRLLWKKLRHYSVPYENSVCEVSCSLVSVFISLKSHSFEVNCWLLPWERTHVTLTVPLYEWRRLTLGHRKPCGHYSGQICGWSVPFFQVLFCSVNHSQMQRQQNFKKKPWRIPGHKGKVGGELSPPKWKLPSSYYRTTKFLKDNVKYHLLIQQSINYMRINQSFGKYE